MRKMTEEQLDKFYVDLSVGNYTIFEFIKALSEYGNGGIILEMSFWDDLKWVIGSKVYDSNYAYKAGDFEYFFVWSCKENKSVITCSVDKVTTGGEVVDTCKLKIKVI
jgi:hypothetical protein